MTLEEIKKRSPELYAFLMEIKKHFGGGTIKNLRFKEPTTEQTAIQQEGA